MYAVAAIVVGAVMFPALRPHPHDSFPLSNFPMFSYPKERINALPTAVAVEADGTIRRLTPTLISGGYEPVRAFATVEAAVANGDTAALCQEIATRVRAARPDDRARIEVVTEVHDTVAWFRGDREPLAREVHATC